MDALGLIALSGGSSGGGGTEVIANPTLAGTEGDLTGLQVGDTKYKIPSGGGGVTRDVLYTNPSPTTAQGQITLNLSEDATKYDIIEVHFAENATYDGESVAIFNMYGTSPGITLYSGSGNAFSIRTGYLSTPTTLFVKVNYLWDLSNNSSSQYNYGNVIRKVVGVKY